MPTTPSQARAPLSDAVILAVARLVDDAQTTRRDPSHSDLEFQIDRARLSAADPNRAGQVLGKAKRVRAVLSWALENNPQAGEVFVSGLVAHLRACGGFRETSPNYIGLDAILDAADAFRPEGYELSADGDLRPLVLDNLSGVELTAALEAYVRRAKRGSVDAALLTGTGKDLLEAVAAHVLVARFGSYPTQSNFPTLLGQAFIALGMATPEARSTPGEPPQRRLQRALYESGCAVNALRNRAGTGHGRPWLPNVTPAEARTAAEVIGMVSEHLLRALRDGRS